MSKRKRKNNFEGYAEPQLLISFKDIYPDLTPPDICATLSQFSRAKTFRWIKTLICDDGFERLMRPKYLGLCSSFIDDFGRRCQRFAQEKGYLLHKHNFVSILTELELLKYIFSTTNPKWRLFELINSENLIKIMLLMNEEITQRNGGATEIKKRPDLEKRLFAMLLSQDDIVNFDPSESFRDVLIHFVYFKEYVEKDEEFKSICDDFLKKLNIDSLDTYFWQIVLLREAIMKGKRYLAYDEVPARVSQPVLDYISIPYDQNVPLDANFDYKAFRDKPLIKMPDGGYLLTHDRFLLERIFYCFQFDFPKIKRERGEKWDNKLYTLEYMEKYFLYELLGKINSTNMYFAKSGVECGKNGHNDGEPDYYLKSRRTGNIILFENKSVLIKSKIKQEGNYDKITEEWEKKALSKPRDGKDGYKAVGVGQLIRNIQRVIDNDAFWDNDISASAKIYPVLVLSDIRQVSAGHTNMFQEMFAKECKEHQIPLRQVGHLILMSITTLKLYENEFRTRGLEHYFECYYKKLRRTQSISGDLLQYYQASVSFPEFMGNLFPKNREIVHQDLISRLQIKL
ncbi:hypothetical protein [Porphyromonas sp.]|uniref:hypothetical protein n=1 Tax=Porphyromonas sp. TaxID=1924944 RepID=UPI0026DB591A|nr:hypothetical protein [Porphyromonas sp.]MDO4771611.1 hypothetical protein [Porphyromonas sp.]